MPSFFTSAHLRLSLLLAVLGGIIALIFTVLSDSGIVALIARPLVSALVMFILGSVLYALLAKKVPEAIDVIENKPEEFDVTSANISENEVVMPSAEVTSQENHFAEVEGGTTLDSYNSGKQFDAPGNDIPRKAGVQIGKEEIVVDGVKFKNQPEVMAETIKQLMDQDKD